MKSQPYRTRTSRIRSLPGFGFTVCLLLLLTARSLSADLRFDWTQLPPLPDPLGLGGLYGGMSGKTLVVAGGSNFPDKMPWDGGRKAWNDTAFALDRTNGAWRSVCKLPQALGYGVSIGSAKGLYCIGGSTATEHVRDVFRVVSTKKGWKCESLAPLPKPLAYSCGALVGNTIYVAGGTLSPDATTALNAFWALDLQKPRDGWRELEPWPGPGRMLATAASIGRSFYIVGGTSLAPDSAGKPVRTYLKDGYRFIPGKGWKLVAEMPFSTVAAPTPAPVVGKDKFLIIGGDDGSLVNFEPKSKHPGFPPRVMSYDVLSDRWSVEAQTPASRATLPAVVWDGLIVLPSGEAKPGVRSREVWAARVKEMR